MKKELIITLVFITFSLIVQSQDALLEDGNLPEAEIHAAINPTDSDNIVVAAQHGFADPNDFNLSIYYTTDFGDTWNISDFKGIYDNTNGAGDVVLAFDKDGNILMVNLIAPNSGVDTILSKSTDGGATWSLVSTVATVNTDKPWLAVDRYSSSPNVDNVYIPLVENEVNLYVLDENYQTTASLEIEDGNHLPSIVVKKDGTVFTSTVNLDSDNVIYVQEYSNGGTNLIHSTQVVSFPDYTFNAPDISKRFQPTVYLAIDNSESGNYAGRLYLTYTASETDNPDYFNVFLTYSDDNGATWSTPKVVHSDTQDEIQQFYSSIYVNESGVLLLDWYDRKNHTNTNKDTDFFIGVSYDGGETFTEAQLNSSPSDFDFVIPSSNDFGIGEYHQLVATNDTAVSFWSDGRTNDGDLNIYMAKTNLDGTLSVDEYTMISDNISVSSLYPLPTENNAHSIIKLKEATNIKHQIFNALGQKVKESDWKQYQPGKHTLTFDFTSYGTGTYFVKIKTSKGYFKSMKLIKK